MTIAKKLIPRTIWGRLVTVLLIAAVLFGSALLILTSGNKTPDYVVAGSSLTNAEELITEAEADYATFLSTQHGVEVKSVDGDVPLCFLVTTGDELTDKMACGAALHSFQDVGGYDTVAVSYTRVSETDIHGAVDGEFNAGGEVAAGSILTRPDGKAPLPGDALVRPEDASVPLPEALTPAGGTGVLEERVEVITEVVKEPVIVRVPGKTIEVTTVSARDVRTDDGSEYRTERGTEVITVQGDIREEATEVVTPEPTYTLIIVTEEGEERIVLTPAELEEGFEVLVPTDSQVELGVELDGVEQRLDLREDTISSDHQEATDLLYAAEPRTAVLEGRNAFRVSAEEATVNGRVQQVAVKPYLANADGEGTWAQEEAFVEVVVGDLGNFCRNPIYNPTIVEEPYEFDSVRLRLDGEDLGAPDVAVRDDRDATAYRLAWEAPADASTMEFSPNIAVQCEGSSPMSDEVVSYTAQATEEAAGWMRGEFVTTDEEAGDVEN